MYLPSDKRAWLSTLVATIVATGLLLAARGSVDWMSALATTGLFAGLGALHCVYRWRRPEPMLADLTGAIVVAAWSAMMAGVSSLMAVRLGAPLIDGMLAQADAVLRLDAPTAVAWTAQRPMIGAIMSLAYVSSFPLLAAAIVHLSLTRRSGRLWEMCAIFSSTITLGTLISAAGAAIGAFAHYGLPANVLDALPGGAGVYHLPVFEAFRSGAQATVDFNHLQGVVTFPSIHTCLALTTAFAYRDHPILAWPASAWNAIVIASTIPIGGHYFVDLIAGAILFAACAWAVGGVRAGRPAPGVPSAEFGAAHQT